MNLEHLSKRNEINEIVTFVSGIVQEKKIDSRSKIFLILFLSCKRVSIACAQRGMVILTNRECSMLSKKLVRFETKSRK